MENIIKKLSKDTLITILPHDTVDVDAAFSAILLSKIFDYYEIPNEILIFDKKINKWTMYFLSKLGYDLSEFLAKDEDESRKLFLVDHYKTSHKGNIIGCIDHHYTSEKLNYDYYLYSPACSATYYIYKIMKKLNFKISREIIQLVGYASFIDTCSFKSTKWTKKEKDEIISLLKDYNFNVDEMLKECLCIDDLSKMSLEEIIANGFKRYEYGKNIVKSSYVQITSLEISEDVINLISKIVAKEKLAMWVFIVSDMINEKAMVYKITQNQIITEKYDKILSRGKDIMPVVEKQFCD